MEKVETKFGGGPAAGGDIEVMMNTFYRSAAVGFAQNTPFGTQIEQDESEEEEGFEAQEYS
jgi:hypothetical protein